MFRNATVLPSMMCILSAAIAAAPAFAQRELELRNDGLEDGGQAAIQLGFVDDEIGAATFSIPKRLFPIKVERVQIFWLSATKNTPPSVQDSIRIYRGGLPRPTQIAVLDGPQLIDGFLNEFDVSAFQIILEEPSLLTIGLKFSDAPNGNRLKPSLVTDTDGCQPGKNPLFAIPGGWKDLCGFGASGDFVIRAIISTGDPGFQKGDLNCDGSIDLPDVEPFVLALLSARQYKEKYPDCDRKLADVSEDGTIDLSDVEPFIKLLIGP